MNYESHDGFEQPLFSQHDELGTLEEQLYGHVRKAIDFDALASLEHALCMMFCEQHEMSDELSIDLAAAIMHRAFLRAANDSARYCDSGAPPGITEAEKAAVAFDEECPFCLSAREAAQRAAAKPGDEAVDDEPCACCDMLAESWREEHRETLVKAGLAKATDMS